MTFLKGNPDKKDLIRVGVGLDDGTFVEQMYYCSEECWLEDAKKGNSTDAKAMREYFEQYQTYGDVYPMADEGLR